MKKLLSLLLALILCFSMAACSKKKQADTDKSDDSVASGSHSANVGGAIGTAVDLYDLVRTSFRNQSGGSAGMEMSLELSDDLLDMLSTAFGASSAGDIDLDWLNNLTIGFDTASKDNLVGVVMKLGLSGTQIVSMDIIADAENGKAFVGIPELSDKYLSTTLETNSLSGNTALLNDLGDALPDGDTVAKLLDKYLDIVLNNITLSEKQTVELTASGVTQSVSRQELVINDKLGATIGTAVLTELKNDADVKAVINDLAQAYDGSATELYDEFVEGIDETLADISNDASEEMLGKLVLYTAGEELVGFEVYDADDTAAAQISCLVATSGDETGLKLAFNADSAVEISGSGTHSGNKLSGTYTVSVGGKAYFTVKLIDFASGATAGGKVQLWPEDAFYSMLDSQTKSLLSVIDLGLELELDGASDSAAINILNGSAVFAGITIKATSGSNVGVSVPSDSKVIDSSDTAAVQSWMASLDLDVLIANLRKGGLPSEWLDMLSMLTSADSSGILGSDSQFTI